VVRLRDGALAAVVQARHVFVDPETFTRSTAPEALRLALAKVAG